MPTVLYVGNFEPPHSTENDVRLAFEALGWHVDTMQERAFTRAFSDGSFGFVYDRALAADLVLHTMTQGSYPDAARVLDLWAACARAGIPTASIHLDLFYGLSSRKDTGPQRYDLPRTHPMFRVAHVFTADGGHATEFARDGVNHHWLPPGVRHTEARDVTMAEVVDSLTGADTWVLPILQAAAEGRYLVGFAGSANPDDPRGGYHPEHGHRDEMVRWLRNAYADRFLWIGGASTPRVTGLALNALYAAVPVWVGDSCLTRPDFAYWSDRVPETWGRGGFLIHPRVGAMEAHYNGDLPGHAWEAGDWDALAHEVEYWLASDSHRESTGRWATAKTRQRDTYVSRVGTMLDTIGIDPYPNPEVQS